MPWLAFAGMSEADLGAVYAYLKTLPPVENQVEKRPRPVVPPPQYRRAVAAGTRSVDGRPGAAHWRNHASYDMRAALDPATGHITGAATIRYQNRSPDPLGTLALRLYLNIHRAGAIRNEAQEVTDGVTLHRLTVDGLPVPERTLRAGGTVLNVRMPRDLAPGGTATLEVAICAHTASS